MKIQKDYKGVAKNKLVWFKRFFFERGHSTSNLALSTFETWALIKIVLTDQFES